jgi:pimeloyl-ACP methyl ester carboxylesterase
VSATVVGGLFVSEFGPVSGKPLLLIHGSTEDGLHDFTVGSDLAERFASNGYRVIVPDCPGHGQSAEVRGPDGKLVYSFAQMASALADLLNSLCTDGQRAHVIGHSNGGTVALYLARFHQDQVRRVVSLAGNACLDARIIEGVPPKMAPDRIERERPDWRDDMVALHDRWHGDGYWRELVQATIDETILNPQWSAAECASVQTPVLAIQGSEDGVNTPGRHAEVIGEWFPYGEAWVVPGAGHSVHWHDEQPDAFFERVTAFLDAPDLRHV